MQRNSTVLDTTYRNARRRIADVVAGLSEEQLRTPVPATPDWTVHELLAHLVGGASDAATDRMDGVTGEQWTERHVGERRHHSVDELLAEWDRVGPQVEDGLSDQQIVGPNLAADVICHEADLREALGLARVEREHWQPFLEVLMRFLRKQLRDSTTVVIQDDQGREWSCGSGEPATVLWTDGYELLRACFSRRSQRQIAAWNWSPAPAAHVIERFGFFGPRHDDQPVPPST